MFRRDQPAPPPRVLTDSTEVLCQLRNETDYPPRQYEGLNKPDPSGWAPLPTPHSVSSCPTCLGPEVTNGTFYARNFWWARCEHYHNGGNGHEQIHRRSTGARAPEGLYPKPPARRDTGVAPCVPEGLYPLKIGYSIEPVHHTRYRYQIRQQLSGRGGRQETREACIGFAWKRVWC